MTDVQTAAHEAIQLISRGETATAIDKILAFKPADDSNRFTLIRIMISAGQMRSDAQVTRCALDAFERIKQKAPKDAHLYYDVANGYQVLYESVARSTAEGGFDCEAEIGQAIRYFKKAGTSDPRVPTNLGNLFDSIGRPVEAIDCYELALSVDPDFAMAAGNKAHALEVLAPVSRHPNTFLIQAHQLYRQALDNETSLLEVGGESAVAFFKARDEALVRRFAASDRLDLLDVDLTHPPHDDATLSPFVRFYIETCIQHDLYLNLHIVDRHATASIGDTLLPRLRTGPNEPDEVGYVSDIALRLNEINESFMTARLLFVRSQYPDADATEISQQTTLVNLLDYSVSNIYVGQLKAAYKEAFSALDKVAGLLNHYLAIGHPEDSVYYGNVWFEPQPPGSTAAPVVSAAVRTGGWRLLGLYLLCRELHGSKHSHLRNALTHRYERVYRVVAGPTSTRTFEELSALTAEVLHKVKCAIMYASVYIDSCERAKYSSLPGPSVEMPLSTDQHLDRW